MHEQEKREAKLTEQMRQGSEEALATLFTHHRARLEKMIQLRLDQRLARRISGVDVLQETYLRAAKRLRHFAVQPELSAFMWMRLLVQQQLSEIHRRHFNAEMRDVRRETRFSLASASSGTNADSSQSGFVQLLADVSSPSETLSRKESALRLASILDGMRPNDREIIVLRHFEELTSTEAACTLGIAPAAAQKRYVRALQNLRRQMDLSGWVEQ